MLLRILVDKDENKDLDNLLKEAALPVAQVV